jgi:hypothetical protein
MRKKRKKLVTVLLLTQFFLFKTGKKGENITQESAFKVFSCGGGRGGGVRGGWFRVLQKYSMYFFIFGVCPKNRHALIYPTPTSLFTSQHERWTVGYKTPHARRKILSSGEKVRSNVFYKLNP